MSFLAALTILLSLIVVIVGEIFFRFAEHLPSTEATYTDPDGGEYKGLKRRYDKLLHVYTLGLLVCSVGAVIWVILADFFR